MAVRKAATPLSAPELLDRFPELRVLVIGEAMLDAYLDGSSGRLCQEAPVPVVDVTMRTEAPGGAANVAVNVRALGAHVRLLSVLGEDVEAGLLRSALAERGVASDALLTESGRRTLAKTRVLSDGQLLLRFDQGDTGSLIPSSETALLEQLEALFPDADAVIVSDYGYGILTDAVRARLRSLQRVHPRVLVVDAKDLLPYRRLGVTAVKANYGQAIRLMDEPQTAQGERAGRVLQLGNRLLSATGAQIAAVTLDSEGAVVFEQGRAPFRTYAEPTRHLTAAGAGDTFAAALGLSLAAGGHTPAAAEVASAAAALVVTKSGTSACSADELRDRLQGAGKHLPLERSVSRVNALRAQGRRIVFTNGCFEILHRGHITYLSQAKTLGDVLVVGINDDGSVRRLKGPPRPINRLEDRAQILAALSCVDLVITFEEDTPQELIRALKPDVFVKGGDYTKERLPEAALVERLGGVVRILPFVADVSTTGIIERIQGHVDPGDRDHDGPVGQRPQPAVR